jgi:hypothetical protein
LCVSRRSIEQLVQERLWSVSFTAPRFPTKQILAENMDKDLYEQSINGEDIDFAELAEVMET